MRLAVLFFAIVAASLLQAFLPASPWLGFAPMPVMVSVVIYAALTHGRAAALHVAFWGGLVEDSLGHLPLGYSMFCFSVAALVIEHFRPTVVVRQWTTHVFFGATVNLSITLAVLLLLAKDGLIAPGLLQMSLRLGGAVLAGAITAPLVGALLERLEKSLGLIEDEDAEELAG